MLTRSIHWHHIADLALKLCGCVLVAAFIVWMLVNLVTGCGNVDGVCILHPTIPTPEVIHD